VELVSRDLEMAQLRQALTSRISIEQAKGVLAASQEVTPNERFQQLRARSSSRRLADLVREVVVQEAQRERVAALAMDDARVRVAEARAQAAKQALQAARTGLTQRTAALDRAQDVLAARERAAGRND
jgi:ANTAR domain